MTGVPLYHGVMVSSTFADLPGHRARAMEAIESHGLHPVAQEQDGALPWDDVVASSLRKVRGTSAYLVIVGRRYGQVPESASLNPDGLSLTELEYREARRLGRPVLALLMSDEHAVKPAGFEQDPENVRKLAAFRAEVTRTAEGSSLHRVYAEFDDEAHFAVQVSRSVAALRRHLDDREEPGPGPDGEQIPRPPAFYAAPRYTVSQTFVGRASQLETLDTWAGPSDPHPVLLFEAIGGTGKSMLTWEWATRHAGAARDDWAGTFWYSFYEKGAVLADFCRRALAYTTGRPITEFARMRQPALTELLLTELDARPWLFVLDGLERVLVAYHRSDAAQLPDEQAGTSDEIADRHPCAAIRPEDGELLRRLGDVAVARSKILITSRLVPRALLNRAGQPVPGVHREPLPGLRPADAEQLLRACGVHGTSETIRSYLQRHCDCHPLVTEIVAGLVADHLPHRGSFDAWAAAPDAGGHLDLAELDLVQKRNHILGQAMDALPEPGRRLLSALALLSAPAAYETLVALNPHLPPGLEFVPEPVDPAHDHDWAILSRRAQKELRAEYEEDRERHAVYAHALLSAPVLRELGRTTLELERRGLLQYNPSSRCYDLHPVVRGVASGRLGPEDRDDLGQRVVDHFTARDTNPYEAAETLDDLDHGLTVVRVLLRMGRTQAALDTFTGPLFESLLWNLEAHAEALSVVRSFLARGWSVRPEDLSLREYGYLTNAADLALREIGESAAAAEAGLANLKANLDNEDWLNLAISLAQAAPVFSGQNRLAATERCLRISLELAERLDEEDLVFAVQLRLFNVLTTLGLWSDAWTIWEQADAMGRVRPRRRSLYRPGEAELYLARHLHHRHRLTAGDLDRAEETARSGRHRGGVRAVHQLRGQWLLDTGDTAGAVDSATTAVAMAHEIGLRDVAAETTLATARARLGDLDDPRTEAQRLTEGPDPDHHGLCDLWRAIGDPEKAAPHALAAYRHAWADGEPFVRRFALDRARTSLTELGVPVPDLPPYDLARDPDPEWMPAVVEAVRKLRGLYEDG